MSSTTTAHPAPAATATPQNPRRWTALVLLCLAQFMLILDVTVVNVALPSVGDDLMISRSQLTWVVTAYVLAFGGLMLLGGRLADVVGRRRILLAGLALFTVSSLICGLAGDGLLLVAGRASQGVGAALLSPAALSIITTSFHGNERNRALGVWAVIGGSGAAVGVLIGGLLTAGPGWEWIFFANVPIGLAVLLTVPAVVPADPPRHDAGRLDVPGALLGTAAAVLLVYGLVEAGDSGWTAPQTLVPIAAAAVLGGAFVAVERAVRNPLIRVELLRQRSVVAGTLVMLVASGLMLSLFFLSSVYLQGVRGFDAVATGLTFLPAAVAITVGAHLAGQLVGRVGGRAVATAALALTALGIGLLSRLTAESDVLTEFLPGYVLAALGLGPAFVVATTTALSRVPHDQAGLASGIVNTSHEIGGAIGVAAMSAVAAGSIVTGMHDAAGFADAFTVGAVIAGVAALAALRLVPPGKPAQATFGHGHVH
jgi:EmrB/QacA subfamily drug resistance transporter